MINHICKAYYFHFYNYLNFCFILLQSCLLLQTIYIIYIYFNKSHNHMIIYCSKIWSTFYKSFILFDINDELFNDGPLFKVFLFAFPYKHSSINSFLLEYQVINELTPLVMLFSFLNLLLMYSAAPYLE